MKSFKQFIKQPKIGFATIHKNDKSDEALKPRVRIGFATIHKDDKSDRFLSTISRVLRIKEDSEPALEVSHAFHDKYLKRLAQQGARYDHQVTPTLKPQKELDAKEFAHHHELNMQHEAEHEAEGRSGSSPLRGYTEGSYSTNRYLIRKHLGEEDPNADYLESRHKAIARETNHPANALKKSTVVHSGVDTNMAEILRNTKVGENLHFPAYTSTSTHMSTAKGFSQIADDGEKTANHIVHFHLPKGYTKGRHVENVTDNHGEHEMILHHGQTFKKVDHVVEPHPTDRSHVFHHHHFVPVEGTYTPVAV